MNTMDDVFDESVKEEEIAERQWLKSKADLLKEGFRDGVTQGQESQLQDGFNTGYKLAAVKFYQLAQLRGKISAILTSNHIQDKKFLSETEFEQLNQLTEDISKLEKHLLKPNKDHLQDVLNEEGQGHTDKQKIETLAPEGIQKSSCKDEFKKCGNGCNCMKNTDVQKCFNVENESTVVREETVQLSREELQKNTAEIKQSLNENILIQKNLDSKINEFKTRLENIKGSFKLSVD